MIGANNICSLRTSILR